VRISKDIRDTFDYGKLRIDYHARTGEPVDGDLLARMATWGPGRADVTEDDEDPVAIPDLWGLAAQSALNQAGTIRQREGSPVALALRQETQFLHANHQRVRPPRELALALAYFLRSYGNSIDASGERLQEVEDRLALLERLKKKHGPMLADVLARQGALAAELRMNAPSSPKSRITPCLK
jgi:hypothetical protein